jgi:hypothetical protein
LTGAEKVAEVQREKTPVKTPQAVIRDEKSDPLMDESMCFAHKSSLEDYIIGK